MTDGTNTYLYGNGRIAQTQGTTIDYFLSDALGSMRQLTDQTGAVTYARAYDPYGVAIATSGASGTPYGYTGEYTTNDLVYLRARHYNPGMGRFLTRDTWGGDANQPMSFNKWGYVNGNSVNHTDPSGLCIFCESYDRVRVDTRGYSADGLTLGAKAASELYAKPSPNSEVIYNLTDNQYVTVLPGKSNITSMDWGWRQVLIQTNNYPIIGWVRNRSLLDNCSGGVFGCYPIGSFTQTYGFGPNLFAERLCAKNTNCANYSALRGLHNGLDFSAMSGTPLIWAGAGDGTLKSYSGDAEPAFSVSYNGMLVVYGHSRPKTPYNKTVRSGQFIGVTDSINGHLHFGLKKGAWVYTNPLHYFAKSLHSGILDKMGGEGGYNPELTAYSMISFDNSYAGNKSKYWFWTGSSRWTGVTMEDGFWKVPNECE